MKRQVLFMAMVLIGLTSAKATTAGNAVLNGEDLKNSRNYYEQPILFVERGVEFLIFADGSFDFNTDFSTSEPNDDNYYYRRSNTRTKTRSRRSTNRTYGAPNTNNNLENGGVLITHDNNGRVRRIGNVFINYDSQGRLKRVGSVYMSYKKGKLKQVGGLRILTNRHGDVIGTRGIVNRNNPDSGNYGTSDWSEDHDDSSQHDDDYYYYRKDGKTLKKKKIKA